MAWCRSDKADAPCGRVPRWARLRLAAARV